MRMLPLIALALVVSGCSSSTPSATPEPGETTTPPATTEAPTATATTSTSTPTATPSVPDSPAPLGQPQCKSATLTITDADTLVDPKSTREVYAIRTSGPDCQLQGYPFVTFQDAAGHEVSVQATSSGYGVRRTKPEPVTLSRSTSVSFEIGSGRSGSCTDIAHVTVTLPGTRDGKRISTQLRVCDHKVAVSPVLRRGDID